jgi:predicted GTPase
MHTVLRKVIIMGAGGRDFHDFNVVFRDNPDYEVVAFTAAQIPGIDDRKYPASLAGPRYPNGIPIYAEERLVELIEGEWADEVVLAYSDLSHEDVCTRRRRFWRPEQASVYWARTTRCCEASSRSSR